MAEKVSAVRGGLLGLAVGDAMGCAVDEKSLEEIRESFGPEGLRGFDLVNGYAEVTSHTQMAAYAANALLVGATRGRLQGRMSPFIRYIALAQREWAAIQHTRRTPDRPMCWISQVPELRRRRCMDSRMLDTASRGKPGTLEEPVNRLDMYGSLPAAVAVGLFFDPERMAVSEVGRLGAEAVALTHGAPEAFLCGGVLSYAAAGTVQDPDTPLYRQLLQAADAVAGQFGRAYPQALELREGLRRAVDRAGSGEPEQVLEGLAGRSCLAVLQCAAVAVCREDFDGAMIAACNHSGPSAAVAAVAGALVGAKAGKEGLPAFYLESLEAADALDVLAQDLARGCPIGRESRLFDDDWDRKYIQGERTDLGR